eukprot:PLAT15049.1.p1 GENE.PLAT15049.1~~PLAT15049.1.p1  ORF type:complete len:433 (+),score=128.42 PLAT15049.1:124-1299(+)
MTFYKFDDASGHWLPVSDVADDDAAVVDASDGDGSVGSPVGSRDDACDRISLLSFNILFDHIYGRASRSHLLYHMQRYDAIAELCEEKMATFVTLQEMTPTSLARFASKRFIRRHYYLSSAPDETGRPQGPTSLCPLGVVLMSRIPPHSSDYFPLPGVHVSRGVPYATFHLHHPAFAAGSHEAGDGGAGKVDEEEEEADDSLSFVVAGIHTTAYAGNVAKRREQLTAFVNHLNDDSRLLIAGDFNLHAESESAILDDIGLTDVWTELHGDADGFTFDAERNLLIREQYYGYEKRRMRLDRVCSLNLPAAMRARSISIIGDQPLYPESARWDKHGGGVLAAVADFLFGWNIRRTREEYLFASDHFGLLAEWDIGHDGHEVGEAKEEEVEASE